MKGKQVVLFHANWCGHCQSFIPAFNQVKKMFGGKYFKAIESAENPPDNFLAEEKTKVVGFPTIKAYVGGSVVEYKGDRSPQDFSNWVSKTLGIRSASKTTKYRKQKRRGRKTVKGGRR